MGRRAVVTYTCEAMPLLDFTRALRRSRADSLRAFLVAGSEASPAALWSSSASKFREITMDSSRNRLLGRATFSLGERSSSSSTRADLFLISGLTSPNLQCRDVRSYHAKILKQKPKGELTDRDAELSSRPLTSLPQLEQENPCGARGFCRLSPR